MTITDVCIAVSGETLLRAERWVAGCERCVAVRDLIPFEWLLDYVTGNRPGAASYVLPEAAVCPECSSGLLEETLVQVARPELIAR